MKRTDAPSRINAIAVVEISMKLAGSTSEFTMEVLSALLNDKQPGSLGKSKFNGPWPEVITTAASQLRSAIEDHLMQIYFEVGDDRADSGSGTELGGTEGSRKRGIVQPPMERATDDTPQL
jgi:hypothetical protein